MFRKKNMIKMFHGQRGQSVATEYVVIFFLAIAAVAAMAMYVRRAFQGRFYDARMYTMQKAAQALGESVPFEYEPYYAQTDSNLAKRADEMTSISGAEVVLRTSFEATTTNSHSVQRQPDRGI